MHEIFERIASIKRGKKCDGLKWKSMFAYGRLPLMTSTNEVRSGKMYRFAVFIYAVWKKYFTSIINDSKQSNSVNEERNLPFRAQVSFDCYATIMPISFLFIVVGARTKWKGTEREKQNNDRNWISKVTLIVSICDSNSYAHCEMRKSVDVE